jgi:hypothetical protein
MLSLRDPLLFGSWQSPTKVKDHLIFFTMTMFILKLSGRNHF